MMDKSAILARALDLKDEERPLFARCVNRLLGETFLARQFDRDDYYTLRRWEVAVRAYLDLTDWELIHDPVGHVFQAVNRHDSNRRALKRLESELLLVCCLAYLEGRAAVQLAATPMLSMADLRQKYLSLLGDTKRLTQTGLRDGLQTLRRYRLIDSADGRRLLPQNPDQGILLLPTLRLVLDVEGIEEVLELLERYRQAPDGAESEDDA